MVWLCYTHFESLTYTFSVPCSYNNNTKIFWDYYVRTLVLHQRRCCSLRGHWAMFGGIFGCHMGGVSRVQGCSKLSYNAQEPPPQTMIWSRISIVPRLRNHELKNICTFNIYSCQDSFPNVVTLYNSCRKIKVPLCYVFKSFNPNQCDSSLNFFPGWWVSKKFFVVFWTISKFNQRFIYFLPFLSIITCPHIICSFFFYYQPFKWFLKIMISQLNFGRCFGHKSVLNFI